jgi:hypothetical protein
MIINNLKTEKFKVPPALSDDIFSVKMHERRLSNNNKDKSDSDEYEGNMDPTEEILVVVYCNATNLDRLQTKKYAIFTILSHIITKEKF